MSLFNTPEKKWIKSNQTSAWNRLFTGFSMIDVMITKLMVYECVSFADTLLSSQTFAYQNLALRIDTILLAKMQFYHLATKSATVHNLFYGYIYELYVNHYQEDIETAHNALSIMREKEQWYLTQYYDYYETQSGDFKRVLSQYCDSVATNRTTDNKYVLAVSTDDLRQQAALYLSQMHMSFMKQMYSLMK